MDQHTIAAFIDELTKIARDTRAAAPEVQDIFTAGGGTPEYAAQAGPQLATPAEKKVVKPPRRQAPAPAAAVQGAAKPRVTPPRPGMAGSVFESAALPEEARTLLTAGYLPPEVAEAATPSGLRRASVGGQALHPVNKAMTEEAAKALVPAEKGLLRKAVPAVTEAAQALAHNPAATHGAAGLGGAALGFAAGRATAPAAARTGMSLAGKGALGLGLLGAGALGHHLLSRPRAAAPAY